MSEFIYKVIKDDKIVKGETDGKSKTEVATMLSNQGYQILAINQKTFLNSTDYFKLNIGGIPFKEKVVFLRQLSYMIQAGLPIVQALDTLKIQVRNVSFRAVIKDLGTSIEEGSSLSQAMSKHDKVFDNVIINLVKAGEESGTLDVVLDRLAFDFEKKKEFSGKVRGALIYPAILVVLIIGVVAMLMIVMIPAIKGLYSDFGGISGGKKQELPAITLFMIAMSDFLTGYWWLMIIIFIILFFVYRYYSKTPGGRVVIDNLMLKIPIFGNIIRLSEITDFARTMSMLLTSGVPIVKAMELTSNGLGNKMFVDSVKDASKKLEKGVILSQSLSKDSPFTPLVFQMLAIGEQTGKTDTTLGKLADYYDKEVSQITANLSKAIEPIILIVMGGIVLVIAIAIYLPIYSLGS